jgi:hypothetical protein
MLRSVEAKLAQCADASKNRFLRLQRLINPVSSVTETKRPTMDLSRVTPSNRSKRVSLMRIWLPAHESLVEQSQFCCSGSALWV